MMSFSILRNISSALLLLPLPMMAENLDSVTMDDNKVSTTVEISANNSSPKQPQGGLDHNSVKAANVAAHTIYKNPTTGELMQPHSGFTTSLDLSEIQEALKTSADGLTEESAMSGTMVRLNGRFQNAMLAKKNAGGQIAGHCLSTPLAPATSSSAHDSTMSLGGKHE